MESKQTEIKLILASASPRRSDLLKQAGYDFTVEVSDADESLAAGPPEEMVKALSSIKAQAVASRHVSDKDRAIVIGADTLVVLNEVILGKPVDEEDAYRMLSELSGRVHQVLTGVTLIALEDGEVLKKTVFAECTHVTMRPISGEEIRRYIAGGEPMDKAGAYGIQGAAAVFISGISGDYYNVVGLPLCRLSRELEKLLFAFRS